ncbi:hypothetical protein R5R35_010542 [Gryllus longicercus]|uniref:EGF-like domain-containing protein n=2 Tax=Gryllus longicercus TaxID=2509291 RepID=A0AAN9V013_9ORTH
MAPPRACLPLLLLLTLLLRCSGDLEPTFSRCCGLGTRWALDSPGQPCTVFPAPVAGVPPEQQSVCLSTVSICCLNTQRHKQCDEGKTAAQTGSECVSVGKPGGEYHKDCCEACKLGLFSGSMNMGCSFNNFSFGYPWDEAYRVCCLEAVTTTTAMTFPSSSSSSTRGKEDKNTIPTPSLDSLCDLLPGQLCAHICIPEPGSYRCACKEGFSLMADKKTCQQNEIADRCKTNNPCEQKCLDTGFSIECSCAPGYTLALDETSCDDIDECALKMDLCTENNLICKNENGSYSCVSSEGDVIKPPQLHNPTDKFPISSSEGRESTKCPTGFHYNLESSVCDDIDECTVNPNICGSNVVCQNTIGSYSCSPAEGCPPGYEFSSVEKTCVDINECEAGFHNCDSQTEFCLNTEGSFTCQTRTQKPSCPAGYKLGAQPGTCEDIDECKTGNNDCPGSCVNTIGSYQCSMSTKAVCPAGFKPTGGTCKDVDECSEGLHACDTSEKCVNEIGHYRCDPTKPPYVNMLKPNVLDNQQGCPSGFSYSSDRKTCLDINECLTNLHNCSVEDNEECVNIRGGFICRVMLKCSAGYVFNRSTMKCEDVNECMEGTHECSPGELCLNEEGGFSCTPVCSVGYKVDPITSQCIDVDECHEKLDTCHKPYESCQNTNGSFICVPAANCPSGYRRTQEGRCEDIDECADGTHLCNQSEFCINERGAYRCQPRPRSISCSPGFKSHATLNTCVDIDECSESIQPPCEVNQICVNQPGGYECKCKPGFQFDIHVRACVDINECQTNQHECTASQRCDNTLGSYQCIRFTSCGTGYTLNAQTGQCEDDDECLLGTDNCKNLGPTFQCRNIAGSFRCDRKRCGEKQVLQNNGECKDVTCPPGLIPGPYGTCVDINECEKENPCRRNQRCINTRGSFRCINLINCGGGFQLNEAGTQCIDIDECALGTHECTSQQTCHNRQGGYTCQCPPGHTVNENRECEDVDECADFPGQFCPSNSICENTVGSYHCRCNDGFKSVPGEKACADIDECTERPGVCHQKCINVWGSYRCICDQGYALQGDGRTCRDIDECDEFKDRNLCIGLCVNEPGKYKCECPEGYRLGSDGRTCQDINECATGTPCRGDNEVCVNTLGGHRCPAIHCPAGFSKDPSHRNRCKRDHIACHEGDLNCLRRPSSYSYNFISFVSNILIPPTGHLDLFTMRGLVSAATVSFNMDLTEVRAPPGIIPASKSFFQLRRGHFNQGVIALVRPIKGPQEIELQLVMELHQNELYINRAIAKLIIYVSEFEF